MSPRTATLGSFLLLCLTPSCVSVFGPPVQESSEALFPRVTEVALSHRQWTGVTVAPDGRAFLCYPRWGAEVPVSVESFGLDTPEDRQPFPNEEWNRWAPELDPAKHFICVQSVVADAEGSLWVLDPANPEFGGIVEGGPKLVAFHAETGRHLTTISFDEDVAPQNSYLNDVRIDLQHRVAYITDSGSAAILVVDLQTGVTRRLLHGHSSVHSEGTPVTIDGRTWGAEQPRLPDVHADGIALDEETDTLYYRALTSKRIYNIRTRWLRETLYDAEIPPDKRYGRIRAIAQTGPADGMLFTKEHGLLVTDLENHAILKVADGQEPEVLVKDRRLQWPDTLAQGPNGEIYVTCSRIFPPAPTRPKLLLRIDPGPESVAAE